MIEQLVNRDRVLAIGRRIVEEARDAGAADEGSPELREAVDALEAALREEPPVGAAGDRESASAYMPNDPQLALLQSLAEEHLRDEERERLAPARGVLASDGVVSRTGTLEDVDPFEDADFVRWALAFLKASWKFGRRRRAFRLPDEPPATVRLADEARVVLVGDWGSGERVARDVSDRIKAVLRDAGTRETHVVHLGDVYYAGTEEEARTRFLDCWPVELGRWREHRSWCLNANHDMYAAGTGLFDVILTDPRFRGQRTRDGERTSELRLANDHWQILGLDSAWKFRVADPRGHAGHFGDEQMAWLGRSLDGGPPAILLSHHQPFTRSEDGLEAVGNLLEQTASARATGSVRAWFWGHEHRLRTFGAKHGMDYTACVGHGAIPKAPARSVQQAPGEWELNDAFEAPDGERWRLCGFAVLDVSPDAVEVRYVDQRGNLSRGPDTIRRARQAADTARVTP